MSIYEKLYLWQKKIVDKYKVRDAFGLFLDMGLGKTPLGLAMAEANDCTKVVIISVNGKATEPETVKGSWLWWAKQSSIPYNLHNKWSKTFDVASPEVLIINYESLFARGKNKKERVTLKQILVDFIISCKHHNVAILVDESHKMKDLQSQQTCAIVKLKRELERVAKKVFTYLLTGTPFTTGYVDLYSQLKMLGSPMNKGQFIENFCERGNVPGLLGWQQPISGYKNIDMLFSHLHKFAITIESDEVEDLPEQIFTNIVLDETDAFKMFTQERVRVEHYINFVTSNKIAIPNETAIDYNIFEAITKNRKSMANPFFRDIDFPKSRWIAETSGQHWMRARQLAIGFNGNAETYHWFDKTRLESLKKFLSENEDNYLLFYNYTPEMFELYDICEELGYNIDVYCGEIKSLHFYNEFTKLSDSQKLTTKKNIILANFASGSTGLNWQEYNKCIIFSCPVYRDWAQGIKRIHRLGQKRTVFYYIFSQDNWLDNAMNASLQQNIEYSSDMFESDLKRVQELLEDEDK